MTAPTIMINYQQVVRLVQHFEQKQTQAKTMHTRLTRQVDILRAGAWQTDAATKFYGETAEVLEGVQRLSNACGTAGQTLIQIARIFYQAEEAGRDAIPRPDGQIGPGEPLVAGAAGGSTADSLFAPGGPLGNKEYSYGGKINTFWTDKEGRGIDGKPMAYTLGKSVTVGASLWERTLVDESVLRYQVTGEHGGFQADVLNVSASASAGAKWTDGKGELGARAEAGAYLARARGNVQYGSLGASADAMLGVRGAVDAKAVFDPKTGTVTAKGTAEAFAGGMIEGSAGYRGSFFSVEGQAIGSAGAGAKAEGEIGFKDGTFTFGGKAMAALGLGGGAGVKVSVNVYKIWDSASSAVGDAWNGLMQR